MLSTDITLIRPPVYSIGIMGAQRVPYLGIAYIAAAARAAGFEVDVIDMCGEDIDHTEITHSKYVAYGMPFSALRKRLKPARVIGFTCMFSQEWIFNRELITYVHKLSPESIIVAGGEHISAIPDFCLKDSPELDICVIGEGEEVFAQIVKRIEKDENWLDIPGIVYRERSKGSIHHNPKARRVSEIDKIPFPAWDLFPIDNYLSRNLNYHIQRGRTIPMLASRGCPYKCTFCSNTNMWGNPWQTRNPKLVVDEMEKHINQYGVNNFVFSDLTAVVQKSKIEDFCNEILNRRFNITWQLPTLRVESLDREVLALMYKAGCRELDFAVESASQKVLSMVQKRNDPKQIVSIIKDSLFVGINTSVNMIIGLPGERVWDFLKSYLLVIKMAYIGLQEVNVFPFVPYPGSKLFKEFVEREKIETCDKYFLSLFAYANLSSACSWSETFGPKTLRSLRLLIMVSFYSIMLVTHPRRIIQLITNTLRGISTTKLEGVLKRIVINLTASSFRKEKCAKKDI